MPLPEKLTPEDVAAGITRYQGGQIAHDFRESIKFDVLFQGKRFPPLAIAALATLHQTGQLPAPSEFTGGAESKCLQLLRDAGFRIVPKPGLVPFDVGHAYTRKQIGDLLGVYDDTTKGDWATDYHFHRDREAGIDGWWFLFPVIGGGGRTGHDDSNEWMSPTRLKWEGKSTSKLGQSQINSLLSGDHPVLLFARDADRDPFTYYGMARVEPGSVQNETPVRVIWTSQAAGPVSAK